MSDQASAVRDGAQLVADFQATMINLAGAEISAAEAAESEQLATGALRYFNGEGVLNPSLIPSDSNAQIARASVDAHIKKIQAEQYKQMSQDQLAEKLQQTNRDYKNRPVTIRVLDPAKKPIESLWFNKQRGFTTGTVNTKQLKAVIEEVWLDKNTLLVKPRLVSRVFEPNRKNYLVYIIDPETVQPMVELELV
ncbi:hypothetical protein KDA14_02625 [Candidatus Saccharibacteria bacterium]|nr:hypothetical protein [Candidatus Saccharibacteria bacterium]